MSGAGDRPRVACWRYGTREALEMLAVCVVSRSGGRGPPSGGAEEFQDGGGLRACRGVLGGDAARMRRRLVPADGGPVSGPIPASRIYRPGIRDVGRYPAARPAIRAGDPRRRGL